MPMLKAIASLTIGMVFVLSLAACGAKGPDAEVKAAEAAISTAKAGQVDAANLDLKKAEESFAKAKAELDVQANAAIKDYTLAKTLLAEAKSLSEKALADQKSSAAAKAKGAEDDAGKKVTKSDPPRIKS